METVMSFMVALFIIVLMTFTMVLMGILIYKLFKGDL
jgi:hypothetical protein